MYLGSSKHERLRHRTRPTFIRCCATQTICSLKQRLLNLCGLLDKQVYPNEAIKLFKTNIAGEYSPRTLPQDRIYEGGTIKMTIDYAKVGLKVGLEIHQQLNVNSKLFCSCPLELFKEEPEITFLRRLRPTQSELGQVDPAAYFEFQKGVKILYEANQNQRLPCRNG